MPLSFQRTSARTRTRRDGREDDEDEDLTACSAGRPSEDACEKPMLRKKTTLEMVMAERRRRLKEEERKGEVRFPASSRDDDDDDDDDDDVKEKDEEEEDGDNDSSVLARIRSVQSSSYGVEVSYTGDEMISKEREREEKEDEGDEEEKQEKQEIEERGTSIRNTPSQAERRRRVGFDREIDDRILERIMSHEEINLRKTRNKEFLLNHHFFFSMFR